MAADTYPFQWKGLQLNGLLVSWNDTIAVRLARHSYLKRDGAEQEPMGLDPGRFTMRLAFMGATWAADYRALVASVRQDARGVLVHPLLGPLKVACTGISDASCEPGRAQRLLEVTIGFEEDALEQRYASGTFTAPSTAAAAITTARAKFQATLTPTGSRLGQVLATLTAAIGYAESSAFQTVNLVLAIQEALDGAALTYQTAATATLAAGTPDPSLGAKLAAVGQQTDAFTAAAASPLLQAGGAYAQPAVGAAVELYAACVRLDAILSASHLAAVPYVVPGLVNLFVLAARLYPGEDAIARATQMLALNRIARPFAIPAGTVLQIARTTAAA